MVSRQQANYEKLFQLAVPLYCPTEDQDGNLYTVSTNGDVYQVTEGQMEVAFTTGGQPTGLVFDMQGSSFIADQAHQAILSQTVTDNRIEITPVIKDFDGNALKGPNSMILSEKNNALFFTDSGPMGETSLENATGSVFAIDLGVSMLKPVIYNKLAYPSGLALSNDENLIYVSETYANRILRIVCHSSGVYHTSVFHQFSGRLGPTALAMHPSGRLYAARYDFNECSKNGVISILNENGELEGELLVQDCPEITGLYFSKVQDDILYATESTSNSLLKIQVNQNN
ncbi:UNKNOWN [Stylonychia lemnae]|uniref:SMP-30/Gluconolactonase/LRE-like region domain-containing protein n=1 Tax=Stylonychia lemnae TaxID=5949 RepID=A0A077ZQ96_STYLE|nr:UNKNOWN [Stylonychia lemnae]|eukprot:CDW71565.1 UNKNOWN [Stylonychia lemnae]